MNVIVRFYWQHDLDLVALAMHPDFDMSYWVKQALLAEARGIEGFHIPLPASQPYSVDLESNYIHFRLTPGDEDDVIQLISGFRSGFRNSAIKIIFRKYLENPFLDVFYNETVYRTKSRVHDRDRRTDENDGVDKSRRQKKQKSLVAKPIHAKPLTSSITNDQARVSDQIMTTPPQPSAPVSVPVTQKRNPLQKQKEMTQIPLSEPQTEETMDLGAEEQPNEGDSFDLFSAFENLIQS